VVDNLKLGEANLVSSKYEFNGVVGTINSTMDVFKCTAFLGLKRLIDIALSSLGIIVLSPLLLLIATAIKLDSKGPVIFRQKRCGKNGKDFMMFKFRTMVKDAEGMQQKFASKNDVDGPMFKMENDPRVTRVGRFLRKTSLDELPQLINVLMGEMSLVGPRPLVMDEMKFSPSWRDIRLWVKPGITGLWQVQGRSEAPFHDWIRYDNHYVKNQSIWLDIKILFKTIKVVLKRVGAL
jgi:exopolysaccharide biosynthesis polyprenyl glycosylphosphotransferase